MTPEVFTEQMRKEGFETFVTVEREANGMMDEHSHPFASCALILAGEITLEVNGVNSVYRVGDIFALDHEQLHCEWYGPQGATYLVGRK